MSTRRTAPRSRPGSPAAASPAARGRDARRATAGRRARRATARDAAARRPRAGRVADGTPLEVRAAGPDDAPTLVFVHGFSLDLTIWHDQWTTGSRASAAC